MEENKKSKDVVFAVFLIFIGSIFLLNTTGVIGWGIWEYILRFWPIFLILGGIKLVLGKSALTEIVMTVIAVILFLSIAVFSYISYTSQNIPLIPRRISEYIIENPNIFSTERDLDTEETETISVEDYEDVESRVLNVDIGASSFLLSDDSELEDYLVLNSKYTKNSIEPSLNSEMRDQELEIFFNTVSPQTIRFWRHISPKFDLILGRTDIPTNVNITLGAGRGEITFDSLNSDSFNSTVGAGKLIVNMKEEGVARNITLDVGAGKMILNIDENVGYRLEYELGVGSISENRNDIATALGQEGRFESSNYEEAEIKINIIAKVGVGSLEINNF